MTLCSPPVQRLAKLNENEIFAQQIERIRHKLVHRRLSKRNDGPLVQRRRFCIFAIFDCKSSLHQGFCIFDCAPKVQNNMKQGLCTKGFRPFHFEDLKKKINDSVTVWSRRLYIKDVKKQHDCTWCIVDCTSCLIHLVSLHLCILCFFTSKTRKRQCNGLGNKLNDVQDIFAKQIG